MRKFTPEDQIPERFWVAMQKVQPDANLFLDYLFGIERLHFIELFQWYLESKTELIDVLVTSLIHEGASEDAVEDLADALVSQGKDVYLNIFYGKRELPERRSWASLKGIGHQFATVYFERFGQNIYDVI